MSIFRTGESSDPTAGQARILNRLQWQTMVAAGAAIILTTIVYLLLQVSNVSFALRWLLLSLAIVLLNSSMLWRFLPLNHPPRSTELYYNLGLGTGLSLLAGLMVAWTAGFLFSPRPAGWLAWLPAALYLLSRIIDLFDGYVARATHHVSDTGSSLDIELDGLGLMIAVLLSVQYGQLPVWYLLLAISRPLFVAAMKWLSWRGRKTYEMPPSENRRVIAGCQTTFVAVSLWPIVSAPAITVTALYFAIPLVASFTRDWLIVSGAINARSMSYGKFRSWTKRWIEGYLPFVARLVAACIIIAGLVWTWRIGLDDMGWCPLYLCILFGLLAMGLLLGVASRSVSILLAGMTLLCWGQQLTPALPAAILLLCTVLILHVGGGMHTLWQPEERFFRTRLGNTIAGAV